jgi:DNA-directed RNA polymerase specialized sigma24 family protein
MKNKTDEELVKRIQETGCSDSFLELRSRHLRLCTDRMKKYWGLLIKMGYSEDQILHERDLAISRAILNYNKKDSAVNTWIGNNVRYWFLNLLKKFNEKKLDVEMTTSLGLESKEKINQDYDIEDFIDKNLSHLDSNVKLVFTERFVNNQKLKYISEKYNISHAKITKFSKIGREHLKKIIKESESVLQ